MPAIAIQFGRDTAGYSRPGQNSPRKMICGRKSRREKELDTQTPLTTMKFPTAAIVSLPNFFTAPPIRTVMTELRDELAAASYTDAPLHRYPRWAMRFWHGMDFLTWMKLLFGNRFAFAPIRLSMVITVTIASMLNSFASVFQWLMF